MNNLKIRRTSAFAFIILAASLLGFKVLSQLLKAPEKDVAKARITKVDVMQVENSDAQANIAINGRLMSKYKIDIFTEVSGKLLPANKPFKEGVTFNKGEALLRSDDTNYRMNLNATRSSFNSLLIQLLAEIKIEYPESFDAWNNYIDNFKAEQSIADLPELTNAKAKKYITSKGVYTQFYNIKSQEAQLDKYTIIAPFTGVINNANVNANTLVRAGQQIAEFINPEIFELEVGVSLAEISKVSVGDKVELTSNDIEGEWEGKISRISESIDEKTMTFKIYIEVKSSQLFEGMYLKGIINSFRIENVVKVPSNLIIDNQFVYVVEDSTLKILKVDLIHENDNFTYVRGLKDKSLIVKHPISNAFEGMSVTFK
jgi:multidrug efflux pump subunit AcrA (membrane-fusion protein)